MSLPSSTAKAASLSGPVPPSTQSQTNYASITTPATSAAAAASAASTGGAVDNGIDMDDDEEEVIIQQSRRYQPGDPIPGRSNSSSSNSRKKTRLGMESQQNDDDDHEEEDDLEEDDDDEGDEEGDGLRRRRPDDDDDDDDDEAGVMTIQELLYSSSSYYAIAKPVTLTMILAALAVVLINTDDLRQEGQQAMSTAYQVWKVDDQSGSSHNNNAGETLVLSLANALVMIAAIGTMTFVIVFLYRMRCMKCLIGYMIMCSTSLLGVLGSNILRQAILIYDIPLDQGSFYLFMFNFATVGVLSVFWGQGIPTIVTQGYLVATAVILAWHLSFFDSWTAWCLLFMLALYDLCAVLSSFGPLRALVEAMSEEDAPEMPGLLFEAQLPPEAKKPGTAIPRSNVSSANDGTSSSGAAAQEDNDQSNNRGELEQDAYSGVGATRSVNSSDASDRGNKKQKGKAANNHPNVASAISGLETQSVTGQDQNAAGVTTTSTVNAEMGSSEYNSADTLEGPVVTIPLAIAQVYRLPVVSIPPESRKVLQRRSNNARGRHNNNGAEPLLMAHGNPTLPENPTPVQLRADVTVRMPVHGGRLERVKKRGRRVYLERDRHGQPKRLLWVDRSGKVFAELRHDDDEDIDANQGDGDDHHHPGASSIRLGLGDFIFYSVLVSKAAQYSFATFASCLLVILAGLGGTLLLLAMYHQALPALPISILMGITTYFLTRLFVEPWIEAVLQHPYYV